MGTDTTSTSDGFTYDYSQYLNPNLSISKLDQIAKAVFSPEANTNALSKIASIVLLAAAIAYIYVRSKMVDQQMQIAKQQYEAQQSSSDQSAVNNQNPSP